MTTDFRFEPTSVDQDEQFVQEVAAQIPWGQNIVIFQRIKDHEQREYYLRATAEMGWSRNILIHQIDAGAYFWLQLTPM